MCGIQKGLCAKGLEAECKLVEEGREGGRDTKSDRSYKVDYRVRRGDRGQGRGEGGGKDGRRGEEEATKGVTTSFSCRAAGSGRRTACWGCPT